MTLPAQSDSTVPVAEADKLVNALIDAANLLNEVLDVSDDDEAAEVSRLGHVARHYVEDVRGADWGTWGS